MGADAGGRLVRRSRALHAPHLHARAAASEGRLLTVQGGLESADELAGRAVAVHTEGDGSGPLLVLHVEEVAVQPVVRLAAEERRWEHAGVEHNTVEDAGEAGRRVDRRVQGALDALEAVLGSADVEAGVGAERDDTRAPVAGLGGGPAAGGVHCRWFVGF